MTSPQLQPSARFLRRAAPLVVALLECRTRREAGERVGMSEATVKRWLQIPSFRKMYDNATQEVLRDAIVRLNVTANDAIEALERGMAPDSPPGVQVRAALGILHLLIRERAGELVELVRDLRELKSATLTPAPVPSES